MSLKTKTLAVNVLVLGSGFFFGLLAVLVHGAFLILTFGVVVGGGIWSLRVRCPRCGTPVFKKEVTAFDVRWRYWGGFTPPRCRRCGLDFSEEYRSR